MKPILITLVLLGIVLMLPYVVLAATNSEIIAILHEGIDGLVRLVRDSYCAAGIVKFCP